MLANFIKAIIVGLGASIPLGPLGIMCIQKTISKGRNSGFSIGLGSSLADVFYATIALFSLSFINDFIEQNRSWVMRIGGIIIFFIGLNIAVSNPVRQLRQPKKNNGSKHAQEILQGFAVTISNPGHLYCCLVFALVGINIGEQYTRYSVVVILAGIFLGTTSWWFLLSTGINIFRRRFRLRQLLWINRISGTLIALLGLISAAEGLFRLVG